MRKIDAGGQVAIRWQDVYKALESRVDMVQVPIDIGVVEFDAGENSAARAVVEELWPLVEEGRVVFIPLHYEEGATPKFIVGPEVARNTAICLAWSDPADSRTQAMSDVVVVLPCVPATTIGWRSPRKNSARA